MPIVSSITYGHILHAPLVILKIVDIYENPLSPCGLGTPEEIWQKHLGDSGVLGVCAHHDRRLSSKSRLDVLLNWHEADGILLKEMRSLPWSWNPREMLVKSIAIPWYESKYMLRGVKRGLDAMIGRGLENPFVDKNEVVEIKEDPFSRKRKLVSEDSGAMKKVKSAKNGRKNRRDNFYGKFTFKKYTPRYRRRSKKFKSHAKRRRRVIR